MVLKKDGRRLTADQTATANRRAELRQKRGPLAMFDRGPYFAHIKRDTGIAWPDGWSDPDDGCFASDSDETNWQHEAPAVRLRNA